MEAPRYFVRGITFQATDPALQDALARVYDSADWSHVAGFGTSGPQVIEHFHGVPFKPAVTRIGNHELSPATLMMGHGYDPVP